MLEAKQDFVALTTFRAIGALCVIQFHAWMIVYPAWPESWIFHGIELWPDYFFALSGFILMHVYSTTLFARKNSLYNYFVHRVARVYPLHLFMLVVLIGLEALRWALSYWKPDGYGHFFSGNTSPKYIITNLLLVQAWGIQKTNSWNIPAWSVSAEFACYLVFPLLLRYKLVNRKIFALALVLFAIVGLSWIQFTRHTFNVTYDLGVPRAFFSFSLGCVLYEYRQQFLQSLSFIPPLALQAGVIIAIVAAIITNAAPLVYIPLWILLIASFTYEDTALAKALSWKPFVRLGDMSYSLYMTHIIVLWVLFQAKSTAPDLLQTFLAWPRVLILFAIIGATIGISMLTFPYVENTGRAFIRKRFDRRNAPRAA